MSRFPQRLKELRIDAGLSQQQLAKNTGISQTALANWELNQRTPNLDLVIVLADYFNVSIDYLAGRVD